MSTQDIEQAFNEARNGSWDLAIGMIEDLIDDATAPLEARIAELRSQVDSLDDYLASLDLSDY